MPILKSIAIPNITKFNCQELNLFFLRFASKNDRGKVKVSFWDNFEIRKARRLIVVVDRIVDDFIGFHDSRLDYYEY